MREGEIIAVLDIDSDYPDTFDMVDAAFFWKKNLRPGPVDFDSKILG